MRIKNDENTPAEEIVGQLNEMRPLPLGRAEFEEWSDRIISGALLPVPAPQQKFVLADMLLHLGPQEDHKPDAFFIKGIRKFAVNQLAVTMRQELKEQDDARRAVQAALDEELDEVGELPDGGLAGV